LARRSDLGVQVLIELVQAPLQGLGEAFMSGYTDLADPPVLQKSQDPAEHEQSAQGQPRKHGLPMVPVVLHPDVDLYLQGKLRACPWKLLVRKAFVKQVKFPWLRQWFIAWSTAA
jgi:hypothetical protein